MAYSIEIGPQTLLACYDGESSPEEIFASYQEMSSHPSFRPGLFLIIDDQGSTFIPTKPEMMELIDLFRTMGFLGVALVVVQTHHYGIARQMEVFTEDAGYPLRVFKTRTEADDWIAAAGTAAS